MVEGVRFVLAAADTASEGQQRFEHLIVSPRLLTSRAARDRVNVLRAAGVDTVEVTPEAFRQLSTARRASGVAAVVRQHWTPLTTVVCQPPEVWLGVRHIDSPGNLGTMMRTAAATGARGVVFFGGSLDPFHPAVVRASMGAIFELRLVRTGHQAAARRFRSQGAQILLCDAAGSTPLWDVDFSSRPSLVIAGNERKGLTDEERALCDATIAIPLCGRMSSLNVAVATSIVLVQAGRVPYPPGPP